MVLAVILSMAGLAQVAVKSSITEEFDYATDGWYVFGGSTKSPPKPLKSFFFP